MAILATAGALVVGRVEAVAAGHLGGLGQGEVRQLLGGLHVANVLVVALGENEVDLLEGAARRLGVEEVQDRQEEHVENSEETKSGFVSI